jgi:hypothetical protein
MKIADKIKFSLMRYVKGSELDLIIPNFYLNSSFEMDVCKITKAGIVYEFEIKISRSDFKNDFKKAGKHDMIKHGKRACNYFFFVVPEGLVSIDEVPDYCGLYYFTKHGSFNLVRGALKLHRNKFLDYKMLCQKLVFRMNIIQGKYNW